MSAKKDSYRSSKIETGVGPITDQLLNSLVDKLNSDNFKTDVMGKLMDPVSEILNEKIKPYIQISMALYGIVIILMLVIIYLLITQKK